MRAGVIGVLALHLVAACSTRRPEPPAAAPAPGIEVRGARGELLLAMVPRAQGWGLRLPGAQQQQVRVSANGSEVLDRDRRVAGVRPGPAGLALDLPDGTALRVTVEGQHVNVIDARGVILLAVEGRTARDGAGRVTHTIESGGDRLIVAGPQGERLGTVHNVPTGARSGAAAVLAAAALDPRARAALAAYLLSR